MIFLFKIYNLFLLIKSQLSPIITIKPKQANYIKAFMQCENLVSQPTPWKVPMKSPICLSDTFRPQTHFGEGTLQSIMNYMPCFPATATRHTP